MNDVNINFPDLKGKCVSITIMDDSVNHDLFDPHFETQANRIFIVGTIPEGATESNWVAGCQCSIAWNRVTDYVVFESLEAYKKALAISEAYDEKSSE